MGRLFDSKQLRNDLQLSGSFSGSFQGSGTDLTGITAEWDGSHLGDASITGSLVVSGSSDGIYSPNQIKAEGIFKVGDTAFFRASPAVLHLGLGSSTCAALTTERDCIQFRTSTPTSSFGGVIPFEIHDNYIQLNAAVTASGNISASGYIIGNQITASSGLINGDLIVLGTGSFDVFQTNYISSSIIYSSGSTKFGDTMDDTHQFTGSVSITGSVLEIDGGGLRINTLPGSTDFTIIENIDNEFRMASNIGDILIAGASNQVQLPTQRIRMEGRGLHLQNTAFNQYYTHLMVNRSGSQAGFDPGMVSSLIVSGAASTTTNWEPAYVGINVTSPQYQLDVSGSTRITGNISSSGDISASSYYGDGSQLTGIETDPFPYVGDAVITGSLTVSGSLQAFKLDTTNVILGLDAGTPTGTNQGNVLLGYKVAGGGFGSGTYNVIALGREAAYNIGNKDNLIAIGYKAAHSSLCYEGVWIGYESGLAAGGSGGVCIGYQSGKGVGAGSYSYYNTFIGHQSGYSIGTGDNNTALGYRSLYSINDGVSNIAIGDQAGANIVDGNRNIVIGLSASLAGDYSDQLFIGSASLATISASLATGDIIFPSTASAAVFSGSTYYGDGSNLTGINSSTNLTQSLFVSPSGNDATAVVGDLHSPFKTILGATGSANIGDTIMVYPGTYLTENANILKDGVNYYFYPGAFVSSSGTPLIDTVLTYPINVRGAGSFETNLDGQMMTLTAPSGHFEFDLIHSKGKTGSGTGKHTLDVKQNGDPVGVISVMGSIKNSDGGNAASGCLGLDAGNIRFTGDVINSGSIGGGIYILSNDTKAIINANVYAKNGTAFYNSQRPIYIHFTGKLETGDQSNYYAIYTVGGYTCGHTFDGEIIGSIYCSPGSISNTGIRVEGRQTCANSPSSRGAVYVTSGNNIFNQSIAATEDIFNIAGGHSKFNGTAQITSDNSGMLFNITAGTLVYDGTVGTIAKRVNSNTISGGTLIINSYLEHWGGNYPSDRDCFALSGGVLEINNKIKYTHSTTGSGIVNMTGGYLKLNGAQLISYGTGSFAHCIELNNGNHSGSIFGNSWTNTTPFGELGTFTNEVPQGGGTLFYWDNLGEY